MNPFAQPKKRSRAIGWATAMAVIAVVLLGAVVMRPGDRSKPVADIPSVIEISRQELLLRDGRFVNATNGAPFTGIVIDHYEGGELKSRSTVLNGLLEGLSEGWYPNGQKQVEEHFQAGVSSGLRTKWYATGPRQSEVMIVDGQLQGTFKRWFESGLLSEQVNLSNGLPNGLSLAYHPSGSLKARVTLRAGKVLERQSWSDGEFAE